MKKISLAQAVACGLLGSALLCGPAQVSAQQFAAPGTDYLPDGSRSVPIGNAADGFHLSNAASTAVLR